MTTPTTPGASSADAIPADAAPVAVSTADGRVVEVTKEPVELYKILKFEGMAESGGQAKAVIAQGQVTVNGVVELQKRKKIMSGDKIEFNGEKIVILFSKPPSVTPSVASSENPQTPQPITPTAKPE